MYSLYSALLVKHEMQLPGPPPTLSGQSFCLIASSPTTLGSTLQVLCLPRSALTPLCRVDARWCIHTKTADKTQVRNGGPILPVMIATVACTMTAQDLAHLAVYPPPRMDMARTSWALDLKDFLLHLFLDSS
jgi:hypothetical protein